MKLTSAQIESTLNQFDAEAIPDEHPLVPQLERIFGDHTYFLDNRGLNIVEPVERADGQGDSTGVVVSLADWTDHNAAVLKPHTPEPTEQLVRLELN